MKIRRAWVLIPMLFWSMPLWAHEGHEEETVTIAQKAALLGLGGLKEMISVHPLFAHFPVALLLASAFLYFLGVLTKKSALQDAGRWTLWLGTATAALAVWTGLGAENSVPHDEAVHRIMELHENLGFAILVVGAILSGWVLAAKKPLPEKGKILFLAALAALSALIVQQADLGGRMVYAHGTGVGLKSMLQESGHSHSHGDHDHP